MHLLVIQILHYLVGLSLLSVSVSLFVDLFRAQEPKAPVTYCDHALSGVRPSSGVCRLSSVRQFTFSTSSPEPLDGF